MLTHEYVRNGHRICIEVDENSQGHWAWSYTIDGGHDTELRERRLKGSKSAMSEAEGDANSKVDRMPSGDAVD